MAIRYKYDIQKQDELARSVLMRYPFYEHSSTKARDKLLADASILRCDAGQVLYGHRGPCDKVILIGAVSMSPANRAVNLRYIALAPGKSVRSTFSLPATTRAS